MIRHLLLLFLLAFASSPTPACSPAEGYRTPANVELVQKADLIVLARVVDGPDDPFGPRSFVAIEPVRVFKGKLPGDPLRLIGSLKWNGAAVPAMPSPLATAHVSTGIGACIRLFYPKGGLVVAMFQRTDLSDKHAHPYSMTPLFEPFARSAEDVESADGVWVKAVETYVALLAGTDPAHLRAAIEAKRTALLVQRGDLAAQAIADDLAHYLDATGQGTTPVHKDGPHWRLIDLPEESAALLGSDTVKARILRCRTGSDAVELHWPEEEGAAKVLRLGEWHFALTPAHLVLAPDMKSRSATASFDRALRTALLEGTGDAGLETATGPVAAPPLDILQKFALRCDALLSRKMPG